MKLEDEIMKEIEMTNNTLSNYRKSFNEGKIQIDIYREKVIECNTINNTLMWVLGKNNRYD